MPADKFNISLSPDVTAKLDWLSRRYGGVVPLGRSPSIAWAIDLAYGIERERAAHPVASTTPIPKRREKAK